MESYSAILPSIINGPYIRLLFRQKFCTKHVVSNGLYPKAKSVAKTKWSSGTEVKIDRNHTAKVYIFFASLLLFLFIYSAFDLRKAFLNLQQKTMLSNYRMISSPLSWSLFLHICQVLVGLHPACKHTSGQQPVPRMYPEHVQWSLQGSMDVSCCLHNMLKPLRWMKIKTT